MLLLCDSLTGFSLGADMQAKLFFADEKPRFVVAEIDAIRSTLCLLGLDKVYAGVYRITFLNSRRSVYVGMTKRRFLDRVYCHFLPGGRLRGFAERGTPFTVDVLAQNIDYVPKLRRIERFYISIYSDYRLLNTAKY